MKQDQSNRNRTNTSDRKAAVTKQRADFVSTAEGRSSYIERNWARMNAWAAHQRPDLHPAPVLTAEAKEVVHRFTLTPAARRALEQERNDANRD